MAERHTVRDRDFIDTPHGESRGILGTFGKRFFDIVYDEEDMNDDDKADRTSLDLG